jgi:hypothetical protein
MTSTETNDKDSQLPYCLNVIGIGRSGAGYVDGLLRTGEIEDILLDPRARISAMVVDIGSKYLSRPEDYADTLKCRLEEQGIPGDNFNFQSVCLDVPKSSDLITSTTALSGSKKNWINKKTDIPEAGSHFARAVAKAIYNTAYADDSTGLSEALDIFIAHLKKSELKSRIMVCFNLAGGTGSGIALDLAQHLANEKLGGEMPVIGVGQLPHSGDGDTSPNVFASLNELAYISNNEKNASVTKNLDEDYSNPFKGGFFITNTEHSWQRLTSYTPTGVQEVRDRFRQEVTNKFTQDSFMRFALRDSDSALRQVINSADEGQWIYYNLAKFTHPGVQVLPGEPISKWRRVIDQWIDHLDDFSGLKKEFRTQTADVHLHVPRELGSEHFGEKITQRLTDSFLKTGGKSNINIAHHEFFDHLTSYADISMTGISQGDLNQFWEAHDGYLKLSSEEQKMCHSWLLDKDVVLSKVA